MSDSHSALRHLQNHQQSCGCSFTFERKNLPKASLADFPFEASGSFTAAFGSSFGVVFAGLADASPLVSILGGSGGGGGGTDIPLGAAGGSDTWATYSRDRQVSTVSSNTFTVKHKIRKSN